MNLFAYTRQLYEKIAFYDAVAKGELSDNPMSNPFNQPINITIIWVDGEKDN